MTMRCLKHVYGPVPSRRLGRSLGIDLVPLKTCPYDCIYCQLGPTTNKTLERKNYVAAPEVLIELERKIRSAEAIDYISLAGSGEPTLNSGIGDLILQIKNMTDIPVAVLTNGSLLWIPEVQDSLMPADLVIPSLDAGDNSLFQYINHPHKDISFEKMVAGLTQFTARFKGEVWLEILLLAGVTSIQGEMEKIAAHLKGVRLSRIQMNTVVRPPSKPFAKAVPCSQMQYLSQFLPGKVEIISSTEMDSWRTTSSSETMRNEIISLLSRRPCSGAEVARSLGVHLSEALKYLTSFEIADEVETVILSEKIFYTTKKLRNEQKT